MTTYVKVKEVAITTRATECPNKGRGCDSTEIVELPENWRKQVRRGNAVERVGCGNPWHYDFTDD